MAMVLGSVTILTRGSTNIILLAVLKTFGVGGDDFPRKK
jgi:hypothetical protein